MPDLRHTHFAKLLVDYSTRVKPGDRVAITATTAAEPLLKALYQLILERGGAPHLLIDLPDQDELLFAHASDEQLDFVPLHHKLAFEEFDVLIKVRSEPNTPRPERRRYGAPGAALESALSLARRPDAPRRG